MISISISSCIQIQRKGFHLLYVKIPAAFKSFTLDGQYNIEIKSPAK